MAKYLRRRWLHRELSVRRMAVTEDNSVWFICEPYADVGIEESLPGGRMGPGRGVHGLCAPLFKA
jgi:hypothetical protein